MSDSDASVMNKSGVIWFPVADAIVVFCVFFTNTTIASLARSLLDIKKPSEL